YAGPNATARAALALDILHARLANRPGFEALRLDLIGINALHATTHSARGESSDVRVHAAMRSANRDDVAVLLWEVESLLCCGPAGGGGYRGQIPPSVITHSALIDRAAVRTRVKVTRA